MSTTNILLITSDQQHYDTLGVTNPRIRTPHLDRLAREGVRYTRAYCPNPTCSPTRASIITGLYPSAHGCWSLGCRLSENVPTLGAMLAARGYDTALIGKAHFQPLASTPEYPSLECQPTLRDLDFWRSFHGPWYGFSHVETARMHTDESHVGQHYAIWLEEHGLKDWADYFQPYPPRKGAPAPKALGDDPRHWALPAELHHTRWVGERSMARLERAARERQPFFLWASFFDPHPGYRAPEPWASMYRPEDMRPGSFTPGEFDRMPPHFAKTREPRPDFSHWHEPGGAHLHGCSSHLHDPAELAKDMACYYGMTSFIDDEVGRILATLDRLGLAENTLVVYTSDHGHFLGQHGLTAKGPFHYEDLLRVPFLVRQPGRVPAGGVSDALQSLVDLTPTFLDAAGMAIPGAMQGVSQLPVWTGQRDVARDHVLVENRHNPTTVHLRTWIDDRYKVTVYRNGTDGELFDLDDDPAELRNLWYNADASDLRARLLHRFLQAEMQREETPMPRIAGA